ncbi:hypothetical protein M199_gp107 [Halogranum tailed virus 1]|uniref:Uncharacterized protein n=1 Tax=Halogranum tailed virus 1 TaxID=1273749 RepID=R4T748_9CAUD|nr:hypothetical protein M199_gp107 [Halogranum tailed virus 1]AGM11559.1 hypothetical protein HGTV1_262 [Halogranum tailed virus 1]
MYVTVKMPDGEAQNFNHVSSFFDRGDVLELNFHGPDGEEYGEQDIPGGVVYYAEAEDR